MGKTFPDLWLKSNDLNDVYDLVIAMELFDTSYRITKIIKMDKNFDDLDIAPNANNFGFIASCFEWVLL